MAAVLRTEYLHTARRRLNGPTGIDENQYLDSFTRETFFIYAAVMYDQLYEVLLCLVDQKPGISLNSTEYGVRAVC